MTTWQVMRENKFKCQQQFYSADAAFYLSSDILQLHIFTQTVYINIHCLVT